MSDTTHSSAPGGKAAWTDEKVEQVIGVLLITGVSIAAAVVAIGAVLYLIHNRHEPMHYSNYEAGHYPWPALLTPEGIVREAMTGSGRAIIQAGMLLLILTPIMRVAFSVFAFARERDWLYVGITLLVLGLLLYSVVWGR